MYRSLLVAATCLAAPVTQATAQNIDTISSWDGTTGASNWGFTNTKTYGQVIQATNSQFLLNSFTFELNHTGGVQANYQAFVYAWDGSKATGPALFASGPLVAPAPATFTPVTINTGRIVLAPGQSYVLFVTTTTQPNPGGISYAFGVVPQATYPRGNWVFQNDVGAGFADLTASNWTIRPTDLAFLAEFSFVFDGISQTNPRNVGIGIQNALTNGATLPAGFMNLFALTPAQYTAALNSMSGEAGAAVVQSGLNATTQFVNTMFDTAFDNTLNGTVAPAFASERDDGLAFAGKARRSQSVTDAYAAVTPRDRPAASPVGRWSIWTAGYGGNSRTSGDANVDSSTNNTRIWGVVTGANYQVNPDTKVGFALGGGGYNFGLDNALGGGRADTFQLGAFAKHDIGPAYLAAAAAYAWQDISTDRTVSQAGTDSYHASFKANAVSGRLESGWRIPTAAINVTPYAAVQATEFFLPGYGETVTSGTGTFALDYASHDVMASRGELGARWDKSWFTNSGTTFLFKARTAWALNWQRNRSAIPAFQTLPGSAFTVFGAAPAANAALVSVGGGMKFGNGWAVLASYEGEFSSNTVSNVGKGSLKYEW